MKSILGKQEKELTTEELRKLQELADLSPYNYEPLHTYDQSYLIDFDIFSMNEQVIRDVEGIVADIYPADLKDRAKFNKHVLIVAVNLFKAYLDSYVTWIAYSRNKNSYSTKSPYNHQRISHRYLTRVVDGLFEADYILNAKGFRSKDPFAPNKLSRMRATPQLREVFREWDSSMLCISQNAETLILRDSNKQPVEDFKETQNVLRMRRNLSLLNGRLAKASIQLDLDDYELDQLNRNRKQNKDAPIHYWQKTMYRIFANSSFKQGGRFYRCWWMEVSEAIRKHILIDGEATVEKDFSAIHPTILYAHETGALPPHDPYMIYGPSTSKVVRKVVKKLLLVMINIKRGKNVRLAFEWHNDWYRTFTPEEQAEVDQLNLDEVIRQIKKHNRPIASHFSSNAGVKLQYEDSQIAEKIMLKLSKQGIIALPVHDSFIVQAKHEAALVKAMEDVFFEKFGVIPRIK
jgi:hypothetical protein